MARRRDQRVGDEKPCGDRSRNRERADGRADAADGVAGEKALHTAETDASREQQRKARQWNTRLTSLRVPVKGQMIQPPLFYMVWHLTTVPESNDKGAWMGWKMLLPIVLLSSVVAALVGIAMIALRHLRRDNPIPFGPYLAAAGFIALLYGEALAHHVLRF
jgi:hypothetical protein